MRVHPWRGLVYLILLTDSDRTSTLGILCRQQRDRERREREGAKRVKARVRGIQGVWGEVLLRV